MDKINLVTVEQLLSNIFSNFVISCTEHHYVVIELLSGPLAGLFKMHDHEAKFHYDEAIQM